MADGIQIQRSFRAVAGSEAVAESGTLYLVGTPIGNLDDMSFRAVQILKEARWIAAEDTRHTRKLLSHFGIQARLISYHEHNKIKSGADIVAKLRAGETVALVSDAGLPAISDPGADVAAAAIEEGFAVVPIPGPNAAIAALMASGLPTNAFTFLGFLPREKKKAVETVQAWKDHPATMIFYEAPHRIAGTLRLIVEQWGNRRAVLARELTKRHEEFARGTLEACLRHVEDQGPIGEYCLLVEGNSFPDEKQDTMWWRELSLEEHVAFYESEQGQSHKEALKSAALDRHMPKREIYNAIHKKPD